MTELKKPARPSCLIWIALGSSGGAEDVFDEVAVVITDDELSVLANCVTQVGRDTRAGLPIEAVDQALTSFINATCTSAPPLCGADIARTRMRIREHLPNVLSAVHYRIVDVATFRELRERWYASGDSGPPATQSQVTDKSALERVRAEIDELRAHREAMFRSDVGA